MLKQLNESQAGEVRSIYREHPLYVACQQVYTPQMAKMDGVAAEVEDVFCEVVFLLDNLITEEKLTQTYVDNCWSEVMIDVRRWQHDATLRDRKDVAATVFGVTSSVLGHHWNPDYSDVVRQLLQTTMERETIDGFTEEQQFHQRLAQCAPQLSEWINAYTDEEGLLSDEIERLIYQRTDMDNKEKLLEALSRNGISISGDLIVGDKVQNKVEKVENGGIGIQIVNGQERALLTASDKDIKAAIEELLKANDNNDQQLFRNKKQWWAVYRVLYCYCNYPSQMTSFEAKMKELEVAKIDGKRDLSYDSLSAAAKDVPMMATCKPDNWHTLKDKSDNYLQQYVVAEFLMQKLGIKS